MKTRLLALMFFLGCSSAIRHRNIGTDAQYLRCAEACRKTAARHPGAQPEDHLAGWLRHRLRRIRAKVIPNGRRFLCRHDAKVATGIRLAARHAHGAGLTQRPWGARKRRRVAESGRQPGRSAPAGRRQVGPTISSANRSRR